MKHVNDNTILNNTFIENTDSSIGTIDEYKNFDNDVIDKSVFDDSHVILQTKQVNNYHYEIYNDFLNTVVFILPSKQKVSELFFGSNLSVIDVKILNNDIVIPPKWKIRKVESDSIINHNYRNTF